MSKKKQDEATTGEKTFESTYQADKLREAIKQGLSARSIMENLNVKSKQVLKQHVLKLIQEDKVFYEVRGLYEKGGTTIRATPKGELKIGPSVLKSQGAIVAAGDEFHLSVDGDVIILSKVKTGVESGEIGDSAENAENTDTGLDSPLVDDAQADTGGFDTLPDGTHE
jgi:hypothetical protein